MFRTRTSKLDTICQNGWATAQRWIRRWSATAQPSPLEDLALEYRLKRIEFKPLLSTAGLIQDGDDFAMHVNTEAIGIGSLEPISISTSACHKLSAPLRFSLAHELSHLIFLRESNGDLHKLRRHTARLERECNAMAGAMLLPRESLFRELGSNLLDVENLSAVITRFCVSADTLLWRLREKDLATSFPNVDGMLVILDNARRGKSIWGGTVRGPQASIRWKPVIKDPVGTSVEALGLPKEMLTRVMSTHRVSDQPIEVVWNTDTNEVLECVINSITLLTGGRILLSIEARKILRSHGLLKDAKTR